MCQCQQNNCGCTNKPVNYDLCGCSPEPCTCPVEITTNCITLAEDLSCSGVSAGTNFTEAIQQLDEFVCDALSQLGGTTTLINVGDGAEVYKGIDGLGRREIKSITSEDSSVIITEGTNTIDLSVPTELQDLQSVLETGGIANLQEGDDVGIYEMTESSFYAELSNDDSDTGFISINENIAGLGSYTSAQSSALRMERGDFEISKQFTPSQKVQINIQDSLPNSTTFLLFPAKALENNISTHILATLDDIPIITGAETKIENGTNTTVTGTGTIASPYQISVDGTETKVTAGTNISVTGSGTVGSPYVINNTLDGSETKMNAGVTTSVSGNGTVATPYIIETVNLQKAITGDYTLLASDDNYSIKINNGSTPITITVPAGLPENFFAGFTQKGTEDVTFVGSGTTITNPVGLKIKGQGYCVGLEQIGSTNSFDLMADTKA